MHSFAEELYKRSEKEKKIYIDKTVYERIIGIEK
jgi:hypothetical protein